MDLGLLPFRPFHGHQLNDTFSVWSYIKLVAFRDSSGSAVRQRAQTHRQVAFTVD